MRVASLSSPAGLAGSTAKVSSAVHRPHNGADAPPRTSTAAGWWDAAQTGADGGPLSPECSDNRNDEPRDHPVQRAKRPLATCESQEVPPLTSSGGEADSGQSRPQQQERRRLGEAKAHPHSSDNTASPRKNVPSTIVQLRPPPPSSSSSNASARMQSSHATDASSVTSSQYLYAIQQDLETLVQLQRQQLLETMESALPPQQPSVTPQTAPPRQRHSSQPQQQQHSKRQQPTAAPRLKGSVQLQSIDAVKQAFIQDAARLLPPPPMPSTPPSRGVVMSSVVNEKDAADLLQHGISNTSILPHPSADEGDDDDAQAASRFAHVRGALPLPPPPPSSSPIPASLVEYHAYLMQLERQQRQHYEVLRRQRKSQWMKAKEEEQKNPPPPPHHHSSGHARRALSRGRGGATGNAAAAVDVASSTPPRQRMGAASAAADTAETLVLQDRRNRSPPLAPMLRTMRHRGVNKGGVEAVDDAYTEDEEEDGAESDSFEAQNTRTDPPSSAVPPRSNSGTPGRDRRTTTPRRTSPGMSANSARIRSAAAAAASGDGMRASSSRTGAKSSPQQWPRHATPHTWSAGKARTRSPEGAEQRPDCPRKSSPAQHQTAVGPAARQPRVLLGHAPARNSDRNDAPSRPHALRPRREPAQQRQERPIIPESDKQVDDAAADLPDVSPIKPTSSLLEQELGGLSLLNNDDSRLQAASRSSASSSADRGGGGAAAAAAVAAAGNNGSLAGATPSSSPVEAFADALLMDTSGSPGGGGGGGNASHPVTSALLATVLRAAPPAQHAPLMLPFATRSAATAGTMTTTTTLVGGTAAAIEPIAFSISHSGVVVPAGVDPHGGSSSSGRRGEDTTAYSAPQPQRRTLKHEGASGSNRDTTQTPASLPRSPEREMNRVDTTAVGPATTAAASATTPPSMGVMPHPTHDDPPHGTHGDIGTEAQYYDRWNTSKTDKTNTAGQQRRAWGRRSSAAAAAGGVDQAPDEHLVSDGPGFSSFPGPDALYDRQPERRSRHRHHHHRRRSREGISSMIPEHGTGTPRSSRYHNNNNSSGNGGGGGSGSRRQHVLGRSGLAEEVQNEEDGKANRSEEGAAAEWTEKGGRGGQAQTLPSSSHARRVPRHRNGGAHNMLWMVTDNASTPSSFLFLEDAGMKVNEARAQRNQKDRNVNASTRNTHETKIERASKPPWRSPAALISREDVAQRSLSQQDALHTPQRGKSVERGTTASATHPVATATPPSPQVPTHHHHHHPPPPSPTVAAVWHDVKRMWAPGPIPPGPFATSYRYHPQPLSATMPDGGAVPSSSSLLTPHRLPAPPLPSPTSPSSRALLAHTDPQARVHRQPPVDGAAAVREGRTDELVEEKTRRPTEAPAARAAAVPRSSPSTNTADGTSAAAPASSSPPPPPPTSAFRVRLARVRRHTSPVQRSSLPAVAVPLFCMTDSLIGAALQDVLPVCRARQKEVAREVDRRRYQLLSVTPPSTA
ncbi:hypothetical protein ABB37_08165 [Leptomonas pyrrhocoris]|uniref:Uncharacterized protein n=1 Tax=Leptomonas pyrrhocoris TaxID=157538 RepID=A0A0M9FU18_LEPPY|nr:hypothetical protein ABB37_08165 [Leptomonas pyrrhocoris]KPA76023.1 hypothetical protein ABB37_08165 [Leptomonas pyrrhocoris]|eukprot:XP_015654462.1 hypothetical protein ABB37_08165 [Leptomonas pyrrhocoris]